MLCVCCDLFSRLLAKVARGGHPPELAEDMVAQLDAERACEDKESLQTIADWCFNVEIVQLRSYN